MGRGVAYLSLINAGMILFLFLSKLKEVGIIHMTLDTYFVPLLILGFVFLIIIGYIEIKVFRGVQYESSVAFTFTPQMMDMKSKLDYLYDLSKKETKEVRK